MNSNQIIHTDNAGTALEAIIQQNTFSKIAVLVDENTIEHCYPLVSNYLPVHTLIEIKSGEINKTLETCSQIWQELTYAQFDRKSLMINLGGGVIGDMGGFCAATYKRGIEFLNIPTTLLSQVDASVGGKLGIDFKGYKNHIGLFKDPLHVIIDQRFLSSLPDREIRSGFAEIIKHHLIADSAGWIDLKEKDYSELQWEKLVPHSVKIKQNIVVNDPHESGQRKSLNFGHTIGHAVESYLLNENKSILHGEAIAMGMICEAYISYRKKLLTEEDLHSITSFIGNIYPKINLQKDDIKEISLYLLQDKKNKGNTVMAALINGIGHAVWDQPLNEDDFLQAITYYEQN